MSVPTLAYSAGLLCMKLEGKYVQMYRKYWGRLGTSSFITHGNTSIV